MFTYNNTHIFTGYLKQLLSSVNIPTCKIYTHEFANYLAQHGREDPRIVESINTINNNRLASRINYLKNDSIMYYWYEDSIEKLPYWVNSSKTLFMGNNPVDGLTRTLKSSGEIYDYKTHNYLGDFLRFLRDYYNVNLMSLYNCFDNKIYNNIYVTLPLYEEASEGSQKASKKESTIVMNSSDPNYKIYAIPVKLFANYTIAIDCPQEIELFCGFYGTRLETGNRGRDLITKTYKKIQKTTFSRPFLYDCLDVKYWNRALDTLNLTNPSRISRWDILNREQDLKLFLKVPTACKSSITILEGDFRNFNDCKYGPVTDSEDTVNKTNWKYSQNTYKLNFNDIEGNLILPDLDERPFKPICKLQLLLLNTGESYPFADRLVEYLTGSAITPIDEIVDNIKRAQNVIRKNGYSCKIDGIWEPKLQKIIYDYVMNSGPIKATVDKDNKATLVDLHKGSHSQVGHQSNNLLFDILGYVDKDAEKWYATWQLKAHNTPTGKTKLVSVPTDTIQNTDIYAGLYDI